MESITDEEIGRLWAEHFRKRKHNAESEGWCLKLALLIIEKAQSAPVSVDWLGKLEKTLKRVAVPKEQFDQVLADSGITK